MLFGFKKSSHHPFQKSYSQCGEDLIVQRILTRLKKYNPTYLDLGAYHPTEMSNTFHFYEKGFRGVIVEANPNLIPAFKKMRPKDTILNIGAGTTEQFGSKLDFFEFANQTVSTFSKEEKEKLIQKGEKFVASHAVTVFSLNEIIKQYCSKTPDFISVDLEGIDYEVLSDFDFQTYKPSVFCIETIQMPEGTKNEAVIDLLKRNGYMVYADTYINTVFVLESAWVNRFK